ncbi:MAG: sarcosine oxidase subunit gamma [Pseudooceanicola sp.]|nr:sarcosine oxidase subunit gamma [Pseudooceanicola sp.]
MVDLVAKSPCDGLLPPEIAGLRLVEPAPQRLTSIAPLHGQEKAVAEALGVTLPAPGQSAQAGGVELVWFGMGTYLALGEITTDLSGKAALTDQSDAWTVVELTGPRAEEVMVRLAPVDFRLSQFAVGATARTEIAHMMGSITRLAQDRFRVMVFRSMAKTLVHDFTLAMEAVGARG